MIPRGKLVSFTLKNVNVKIFLINVWGGRGGAVAQSVECATPGEEVMGSIPTMAARSRQVGSVSV